MLNSASSRVIHVVNRHSRLSIIDTVDKQVLHLVPHQYTIHLSHKVNRLVMIRYLSCNSHCPCLLFAAVTQGGVIHTPLW